MRNPPGEFQPTWVTCPRGHQFSLGNRFEANYVSGAQINLLVTCPTCGLSFDAAPGEAVEISTGSDGRLRVRQLVSTLRDLREVAREATVEDAVAMRAAVASGNPDRVASLTGPFAAWYHRNPEHARFILQMLHTTVWPLLMVWLAYQLAQSNEPPPEPPAQIVVIDRDPDDAELEQLVEDAVREAERH